MASVLVRVERRGRGGPLRRLTASRAGGEPLSCALSDAVPNGRLLLTGVTPGTTVEAKLDGAPDACSGNDVLTLHVPAPRPLRVYAPGCEGALRWGVEAIAGARLVDRAGEADVRIGAGAAALPALHFIGPGPAAAADPLTVADHPLVAGLHFAGVLHGAVPAAGTVLARAGERCVIVLTGETPPRLLVAMDPDLGAGGLGRSLDFPRFLARALRALAGRPRLADGWGGEGWIEVAKGAGTGALSVETGAGMSAALPLRQGRGELPAGLPLALPELGRLGSVGGGAPRARVPGTAAGDTPGQDEGGSPLPGLLALFALVLLLIEWWALQRGRVA